MRVTYLNNRTRGQWKADGRYLVRESARAGRDGVAALTRDLAERIAADLGTDLEWVAVPHYNTEHPHVYMVIRGMKSDG